MTSRGGTIPAAPFLSDPATGKEPALLRAARRALAPAQEILDAAGKPMLTIAADLTERRPRIRLCCWNEQFEARGWSPPADSEYLKRAHRAIGRAGIGLARQLARHWPANAAPRVVGVVTDGIGLAVSGEYPAALTPAWLHDQIVGRSRIDVILPFGEWVRWTLAPATGSPVLQ